MKFYQACPDLWSTLDYLTWHINTLKIQVCLDHFNRLFLLKAKNSLNLLDEKQNLKYSLYFYNYIHHFQFLHIITASLPTTLAKTSSWSFNKWVLNKSVLLLIFLTLIRLGFLSIVFLGVGVVNLTPLHTWRTYLNSIQLYTIVKQSI